MVFKDKRLLILGGADIHTKVVECANEMGIFTIVADYYSDSPAKKIACQSLLISATDVDSIVEWCSKNPVDGVLSFGIDPLQIPYQRICERLNLPCYGTKNQFEIMTNKVKFKEFCRQNGVGTIPEYSSQDINNDNIDYPVIVKPTDSRGSRGQNVCFNKQQTLEAVKIAQEESKDGGFICEKYMIAYQDISNAFFVIDSIPYLVKFGDRYLGKSEDNLDRQAICTRLPSTIANEFENKSINKVKNMIKKLGVKFGPVFLQGFLNSQGDVFYYDPGLRMPGSDYERILKTATGFDIVKTMIHFSLTGDHKTCYGNPYQCYRLNGKNAFILDISVCPGTIGRIKKIDSMENGRIIYYSQRVNEGKIIPPSGDIQQRVSEFGVLLDNGCDINESISEVYSKYHVEDEFGNDMIVSKVNNIK